jgi:uncharacterized protein CbrC (UPF0167 family)
MTFTYFENPEMHTGLQEHIATCHFCEEEKACFDAESFYGEDKINSICPECLAAGRLVEIDSFTCNGDMEELRRQLKEIHPDMSSTEIEQLALQKTTLLERTTPPLITWQDWEWPCADGDYCRFIGFGSQPLYERLATAGSGEELFKDSFYSGLEDDVDTDDLWESVLPEDEIRDFQDSSEMETLFYVFQSLTSKKIVTIMDFS